MLWFERTFAFSRPTWMLPHLVERVRGTPARLEEAVHDLPPAVRTRRDGERWSIQEHVGHLGDLEPLWLGRVDDLLANAPVLRPADLANTTTHDAGHNDADLDALLAGFRDARARLVLAVERLAPEDAARSARHPRLDQPMRLIDLLEFVAEHDDHHLVRIRELARAGG